MTTYRVRIVGADEIREWENAEDARQRCVDGGEVPFFWSPACDAEHPRSFLWMCPGCGVVRAGLMGTEAVAGWDSPRWVNTGTDERPTLTPSLGCGAWLNGHCPDGHWWLRDGELVPA